MCISLNGYLRMCYLKQIIFCEIDQGCFLQVDWQGHEVERRRLRGFEERRLRGEKSTSNHWFSKTS